MKDHIQIEKTLEKKIKAQGSKPPSVWLSFGLFGLVGWSVVVPTLLGVGLGFWIDSHYHPKHSWTLMLLVGGLLLGSMNAWHWIEKERKKIHDEKKEKE